MKKETFHFSPRPNRASEVQWLPWGEDAFRMAREQSKPLLLSVSAVWCHWCHVMDETSYSDPQVISIINDKFVAVRIDADRRPDLNSRYNQGGWPTTAFLTHDGEVLAGTTYVPPDQLTRLLNDVAEVFSHSAAELDAAAQVVRERRNAQPLVTEGDVDESMVDFVANVAAEAYDAENGGFGNEPKFLYASTLNLLLARLAADALPENTGEIMRTTLDKMAHGGVYDQVAGGFFRYSTTEDWSVPHFEKLLEDNAAMMWVYAEAYNLSGDDDYAGIIRGIHGWMNAVLLDAGTGAFGGSQDADEEYYRLPAEERQKREAPYVDRTVFAAANAQAASALLRAFQVLGDTGMRDQALGALEYIWQNLWQSEAGPYHYHDGDPHVPGLLIDAARILPACIDAYESGAGEAWLDRAIQTADWMLARLQDDSLGGFFDCRQPPGAEGLPGERSRPPVENSLAAAALARLAQNTGQTRYDVASRRALMYFAGAFQDYGMFAAEFALAVARRLDPPVRVTVTGPPAEDATLQMIRAAHRARIPFRSIEVIDPEAYGEELDETGYAYDGKPVAYICVGASCQPPVTDPAELPGRLETGWSAVNDQWGQPLP
ncbi:MAG: thioredoxin domain-containing protein [Thermoleophilia bacterium]